MRVRLNFYNGHSCGISGIARYDPVRTAFIYRMREEASGEAGVCELAATIDGKQLRISDRLHPDGPATCRAYCGVRGSLSDYAIARSSRRKIRYLERLKASEHYRRAVAEAER